MAPASGNLRKAVTVGLVSEQPVLRMHRRATPHSKLSHACIRAKSRRIRWWQMTDANPLAAEAVCGRLYPPQATVVLYLVIIICV